MSDGPEPMTDRLARFTPSAPGLDRDAIVFAAGRNSVRGTRMWKAFVAVLLASQVTTLVVLWPATPKSDVIAPPEAVAPGEQLVIPPTRNSPDLWSVGSGLEVVQSELRPGNPDDYVSSGPTLSVRSGFRFD